MYSNYFVWGGVFNVVMDMVVYMFVDGVEIFRFVKLKVVKIVGVIVVDFCVLILDNFN